MNFEIVKTLLQNRMDDLETESTSYLDTMHNIRHIKWFISAIQEIDISNDITSDQYDALYKMADSYDIVKQYKPLHTQEELDQASKELATYALTHTSVVIKQYLDGIINWESATTIFCDDDEIYENMDYSSLGKFHMAFENYHAMKYISEIRMKREDEAYMKAHSDQ